MSLVKKPSPRRRQAPPIVAAVRPVEKRLTAIESLLFEMRHEQDVNLKRLNAIQVRLDELSDALEQSRRGIQRLSKSRAAKKR